MRHGDADAAGHRSHRQRENDEVDAGERRHQQRGLQQQDELQWHLGTRQPARPGRRQLGPRCSRGRPISASSSGMAMKVVASGSHSMSIRAASNGSSVNSARIRGQ
jgi:hypothetical protein